MWNKAMQRSETRSFGDESDDDYQYHRKTDKSRLKAPRIRGPEPDYVTKARRELAKLWDLESRMIRNEDEMEKKSGHIGQRNADVGPEMTQIEVGILAFEFSTGMRVSEESIEEKINRELDIIHGFYEDVEKGLPEEIAKEMRIAKQNELWKKCRNKKDPRYPDNHNLDETSEDDFLSEREMEEYDDYWYFGLD